MSDLSEKLAAIEALEQAATPGPWEAVTTGRAGGDHWYICDPEKAIAHVSAQDGTNEDQREPDADFIAASREAVPFLLALVREQAAKLAKVEAWAGRNKTGFYDEAQDDVVQILHAPSGDKA